MNIEPTYITFEQAKWLKEKGLNKDKIEIECNQGYDFRGDGTHLIHNGRHIQHSLFYSAPEQWQVVEWLRINHGIWVWVDVRQKEDGSKEVQYIANGRYLDFRKKDGFNIDCILYQPRKSPQEAYSAAFDYIKENNLI